MSTAETALCERELWASCGLGIQTALGCQWATLSSSRLEDIPADKRSEVGHVCLDFQAVRKTFIRLPEGWTLQFRQDPGMVEGMGWHFAVPA